MNALGLLLEAFLYEEQTKRGIALNHFAELNDIADHCTICHRCLKPCPVNIDFGDVTVLVRKILKSHNKRKLNPGTAAAMLFLNLNDNTAINLMRKLMVSFSYPAQRYLSRLFSFKKSLPHTTGQSPVKQQIVSFLKNPMPKDMPPRSLRAMLKIENQDSIPLIMNPATTDENSEAVFYFPGCGSERLFSQVGLSVLKWLHHLNVMTALPPGYICCGYPQRATGDAGRAKKIITDNIVLLHRMAKALKFLNITKIIVSCGTCLDQLLEYELHKLFPKAEIMDIHEYLYEKGVQVDIKDGNYLLHDPCHSPDKKYDPVQMTSDLLNSETILSDRCCGESGTFAVSRADISTQVKFRKLEEIEKNKRNLAAKKILTTCPSCLQGLLRAEAETKLKADYIIHEMTKQQFGTNWQAEFIASLNPQTVENILL